ncbi:protein disulfide-isomerase precursor, partial [Quaeritorhiza haematococci]
MRSFTLWAAAALALCAVSGVTAKTEEKSDVVDLTNALKPHYEAAATKLKDVVKIAKVDCTVETELCGAQGIQGYPTLKVFREGKSSPYNGGRTEESIISYMKKQTLPALSKREHHEIDEFSKSDKVVLMGFFDKEDSDEFENYKAAANAHRDDFVFGFASDVKAFEKYEVKPPAVVLFKTFDDGKDVYEGDFSKESIVKFAQANSIPLMDEIGPENYATYVMTGQPIAYLFTSSAEDREKYGAMVEPLAKSFKGKVSFVYIDAVKYGGHGKSLNLKEKWPAFVIQEPEAMAKYPFDQDKEITAETIKEFVQSYVDGKLEPSVKSEPVPEKNDGPVTVVVGSTYEKIVLDENKDVFLEIYAPWCGHCKKLAPIWEELGEKFKALPSSNIVIAKMDGTENDLPPKTSYRVEGFPTLKLIKAKTNEVIDYEGERTLDAFVEFLKANAVNSFDLDKAAEEPAADQEHDE